jgi:chromosomal replication initiation ATPase DnaA
LQDYKVKSYLTEICKGVLSPVEIKTWINPLKIDPEGGIIKIFVKSEFIKEYFKKPRFNNLFIKVSEIFKKPFEILVGNEKHEVFPVKNSRPAISTEKFFKTTENDNAIKALKFFIQNDVRSLNIHGSSGVGKTALISIFAKRAKLTVHDTRDFIKECFDEIKFDKPKKESTLFDQKIIILDNFDTIVRKNLAQDKLCYLFDKFKERKFIILGQKRAVDLDISGSLKNRLRMGLSVSIPKPTKTTLKDIARLMGIEGEFTDLIDLFFAYKTNQFKASVGQNNAQAFVAEFCKINNLSVSKIKNAKNKKLKTELILRLRELGFTVRDIADSLGLKSHGTVIYAIKQHQKQQDLTKNLTTVSSALAEDTGIA